MKWGQEAPWAWDQPQGLTIPAWASGGLGDGRAALQWARGFREAGRRQWQMRTNSAVSSSGLGSARAFSAIPSFQDSSPSRVQHVISVTLTQQS